MNIKQIIGLICLAVGIYLIVNASQSMDTTGEKIRQEFTGDYSDDLKYNMIGGIILIVIGGGLLLFFRGKKL